MQSVSDIQIKYEHARLTKLYENLLKNHATPKNVIFALGEITIINHKKQYSILWWYFDRIASNYLSKNPNGRESLRQIDSLIAVINNSRQACIHS